MTLADAIRDPGFRDRSLWASITWPGAEEPYAARWVRVGRNGGLCWCFASDLDIADESEWECLFTPTDFDQPAELHPAGEHEENEL